jgi:hypothetical protein
MRTVAILASYLRTLTGLPRWLHETMTFREARAAVVRRLENREEQFLGFLRRCVFGNPKSPYLPLFRSAQCDYEDIARGVRRRGIERELTRLKDAGVWVSLDEFKGRAALERDGVELRASGSDFDNPIITGAPIASTGGSSGRSVRSSIDLDHLAVRASYQALILKLAGLDSATLGLWYPQLPSSSGINAALMYAKLGQSPERWFEFPGGAGWKGKLLTTGLVDASRSSGKGLPRPTPGTARMVLDWLVRTRDLKGRCGLQSYTSRAVQLSRLARSTGHSLEGVTFHVGAEPLTPAREREIRASGAALIHRYASTEMGTIAAGCTDADETGDYHLCRDLIGLVQDARTDGAAPGILYLTSLHPASPKAMINVQLGDCARVVRRPCGCLLGQLGLDTHLQQVRSIGRVTCGGMTVPVAQLVRIVEEVLCPRYGGSTLDYQWVEREDSRGRGHVILRIAPAVGPFDAAEVRQLVLEEFTRRSHSGHIVAGAWGRPGTLAVVREAPTLTARGKALPFLQER